MGRRGWGGLTPADDDDARKRIVEAATRCVERRGATATTLSDVAVELAVTRRTVYRYFNSTDDLFTAVAESALDAFVARIQASVSESDDATELLVEVVAFIIDELPDEPLLAVLVSAGRPVVFSQQMLQPEELVRCRMILQSVGIDGNALGLDDRELDELVELLLRIVQSMVIAPVRPPRSAAQLRAYLRRWIVPALNDR